MAAQQLNSDMCLEAAMKGDLELLKLLRSQGCPWDSRTTAFAAERGHFEVLQWARLNGCDWDARVCESAAYIGHLEMLQWARENGCEWSSNVCFNAARTGNLELLKWARSNGCPWDSNTCSSAALRGRLGVLRWARENGCPWDSDTCAFAAETGQLEVLRWAMDNGCSWDSRACTYAAKYGHLEVLKWIMKRGYPWDPITGHVAAQHGHLEVTKWIYSNTSSPTLSTTKPDTPVEKANVELMTSNYSLFNDLLAIYQKSTMTFGEDEEILDKLRLMARNDTDYTKSVHADQLTAMQFIGLVQSVQNHFLKETRYWSDSKVTDGLTCKVKIANYTISISGLQYRLVLPLQKYFELRGYKISLDTVTLTIAPPNSFDV